MPALRKLEFVERPDFIGWACSSCGWTFQLPDKLQSASLDDLIRQAESLRDASFVSHACADHQNKQDKQAKSAKFGL